VRFQEPLCMAEDVESWRGVCGVKMTPLGERHPSFGPNFKPGVWVFQCPRCGSVRAIEDEKLSTYLERTR
jgi:hypothetical protein